MEGKKRLARLVRRRVKRMRRLPAKRLAWMVRHQLLAKRDGKWVLSDGNHFNDAIAALHLLGQTHDRRWLPLVRRAWRATLADAQVDAKDVLIDETLGAWIAITRPGLTIRTALPWLRKVLCTTHWTEIEPAAAGWWLSHQIDTGGWSPDALALFSDPSPCVRTAAMYNVSYGQPGSLAARKHVVGLLLDPDPEVRRLATQRLSVVPWNGALWIPAFVSFLNRPDVTPEARAVAEKGMRIRGYRAVRAGGRWVARPIPSTADGGVPSALPPVTPKAAPTP